MNINDDEDFEYDLPDPPVERPIGSRFGGGQPTNLGGRPKGSPNLATMARRVATKRHRVTIDGKVVRRSTVELVLLAIQKKAALGDVVAFNLRQSMLAAIEPVHIGPRGVLIAGKRLTEEEWFSVYKDDVTEDEVLVACPYLLPMRRREQARRREVRALVEDSQRQYAARAKTRAAEEKK